MIHETNSQFPFSKVKLCKPISTSAGSFFIKYTFGEHPLYIQPPKCYIKQLHTSKKMYADLVFKQENEAFLQWMENLENQTQQHLYDNRQQWFQTDLEKEDIEHSFASPMKLYKSGKEYIVRANIPSRAGVSTMKIYNEDEKPIPIEDIADNTKVMVILEIQGVRSSTRSFQIDIEIKQMMVLKPEEIFNTCIFKKNESEKREPEESLGESSIDAIPPVEFTNIEPPSLLTTVDEAGGLNEKRCKEEEPMDVEIETLEELIPFDPLCEVDIPLEEVPENETVQLKERKEMYYKMYQQARQKAKVARDLALSAYLEAKQIQNQYMLDDILDSSSSEDSEDDDTTDE